MRISVCNLSFRYHSQPVLVDVDLTVEEGEILGVVGPNGAGKSTFLRALSGVLRPQRGTVYLDFQALGTLPVRERARKVAMLEQHVSPSLDLTVRELVELGRLPYLGRLHGFRPADRAAVERALRFTDLEDLAQRRWSQLSGGERQRALLAMALAQEPEVLLLDEPTAHLDIAHQLEIMQLIDRLAQEGKTVILALHDLNLAAAFAHRLALLHQGRLVAWGPPAAVLTPANLRRVFGVACLVRVHPLTRRVHVRFFLAPVAERTKRGRLLVVGGGGSTEEILPKLAADYSLTLGVVSPLDSDYQAAQSLGIPVITEAPFSPISEAAYAEFRRALEACDGVVVGPTWFGPGNLGLLEILRAHAGTKPILIVDLAGFPDRDFSGGRATALAQELVARGAEPVAAADLLPTLASLPLSGPTQPKEREHYAEPGQPCHRKEDPLIAPSPVPEKPGQEVP